MTSIDRTIQLKSDVFRATSSYEVYK